MLFDNKWECLVHCTLQITILKIDNVKLRNYKKIETPNSLQKIINDFEKRIDYKINNNDDTDYLYFDTDCNYDNYNVHINDWIKKYNLTISIFHSHGNDCDHDKNTELYYLGKYAIDYTLANIKNMSKEDILEHILNKSNVKIIKKMEDVIDLKIIELLKEQRDGVDKILMSEIKEVLGQLDNCIYDSWNTIDDCDDSDESWENKEYKLFQETREYIIDFIDDNILTLTKIYKKIYRKIKLISIECPEPAVSMWILRHLVYDIYENSKNYNYRIFNFIMGLCSRRTKMSRLIDYATYFPLDDCFIIDITDQNKKGKEREI